MQYVFIKDNFSRAVRSARAQFDRIYADARSTRRERFIWDFWSLPGSSPNAPAQYRHLRTPAEDVFAKTTYDQLCLELVRFGQQQFGCWSISKPWLSLYLDGCEQDLHTDNPHGPWAYVLSLTTRQVSGGQTRILRPEILRYWQSAFDRSRGLEQNDLFLHVAPKFNRLVAFDPRLPHGVTRVHSALDPRAGRLVLHGWFVNPEPYVIGGLESGPAAQALTTALAENIAAALAAHQVSTVARGILTFELRIGAAGRVGHARVLTNSLVTSLGAAAGGRIARELRREWLSSRWPRAARPSKLILPLVFD